MTIAEHAHDEEICSDARELVVWLRFLLKRRDGKSVWRANREDVAAFQAARRRSEPPRRISAASWNRGVVAPEKFYGRIGQLQADVSPSESLQIVPLAGRDRSR
jgi:hypothetical protein